MDTSVVSQHQLKNRLTDDFGAEGFWKILNLSSVIFKMTMKAIRFFKAKDRFSFELKTNVWAKSKWSKLKHDKSDILIYVQVTAFLFCFVTKNKCKDQWFPSLTASSKHSNIRPNGYLAFYKYKVSFQSDVMICAIVFAPTVPGAPVLGTTSLLYMVHVF